MGSRKTILRPDKQQGQTKGRDSEGPRAVAKSSLAPPSSLLLTPVQEPKPSCELRGGGCRAESGPGALSSAQRVVLVIKNLPVDAGDIRDADSIPGPGRSPGGGHSYPLQCSCLENPMDRGAWRATVHGVTKIEHDRNDLALTGPTRVLVRQKPEEHQHSRDNMKRSQQGEFRSCETQMDIQSPIPFFSRTQASPQGSL